MRPGRSLCCPGARRITRHTGKHSFVLFASHVPVRSPVAFSFLHRGSVSFRPTSIHRFRVRFSRILARIRRGSFWPVRFRNVRTTIRPRPRFWRGSFDSPASRLSSVSFSVSRPPLACPSLWDASVWASPSPWFRCADACRIHLGSPGVRSLTFLSGPGDVFLYPTPPTSLSRTNGTDVPIQSSTYD